MDKLTLSDVKIKTPAEQIEKVMIDKFGDIDSFANEINIRAEILNQYLKEAKLGSKSFQAKLCEALNMPFNKIVKSKKDQIKDMVQDIYDNIKIYKDIHDIYVFTEVRTLCIDNNLKIEALKMKRNVAMYNFYNDNIDRAIGIMKAAINSTKAPIYLIKWKSELGLMHFMQSDYVKLRKNCEDVEKLLDGIKEINEVDDTTMFLHYYRYGILENNTNNYSAAEKYFRKSLEYARESLDFGDSIMNIALSFEFRENYQQAIKYYSIALNVSENDENKSAILNNLAELHKKLGEYDKASNYIKLAFSYLANHNTHEYFGFYSTYVQIQILKDEYDEAINVPNIYSLKQAAIEAIRFVINNSKKNNDIKRLQRTQDFITYLIKNTPPQYEKYLNNLYGCIGEIELYILSKKASIGA